MSDLTRNMPERLPVPYSSPQARAYAAEDLHAGVQSFLNPKTSAKPDDLCDLSGLLFEVGYTSARLSEEMADAHSAIPESYVPRGGTTHSDTKLADRVRSLVAIVVRQDAQLVAMKEEHDRRVTELLEANNREVERRRIAERELQRRGVKIIEMTEHAGVHLVRAEKAEASLAASTEEAALTASMLADALGCFWNAAIGAATDKQDAGAFALAGVMAEGFAAVQARLEEHSRPKGSANG